VVTGRIERGIVKVGEEMEIVGFKPTFKTVITGVEIIKKMLDMSSCYGDAAIQSIGLIRMQSMRVRPLSINSHIVCVWHIVGVHELFRNAKEKIADERQAQRMALD
jgi:translation elongation factor EF-Tu-like GTPase